MSVLFSLLVARLMTPLLAAYFLKPHAHPTPTRPMPARYKRALEWALAHRWASVGISVAFLVLSVLLARTIPTGFQPSGDPGYVYMNVQGPPGATRLDMERAALETTRLFRAQPDVDTVFAQIGSSGQNGDITSGRIVAKLKDHRSHTTDQMKQLMRDKLALIPRTPASPSSRRTAAARTPRSSSPARTARLWPRPRSSCCARCAASPT
ncbi:MAG: efflux RND transporter permease subunit [Caulobacteraceae bacterium]